MSGSDDDEHGIPHDPLRAAARRRRQRGNLLLVGIAGLVLVVWFGVNSFQQGPPMPNPPEPVSQPDGGEPLEPPSDPFAESRRAMVARQLKARGIEARGVLEAMGRVPRHRFVPANMQDEAYVDGPLPIGHDQTISQPYIVALMTELARPTATAKALDVGTGSGYQAAVLAELCRDVYSIEILAPLAEEARRRLKELGYHNVQVRCGDGYGGWPEEAPFDLIVVAAAPAQIPPPLIDQLAIGGRLVIPVGKYAQKLTVVEKLPNGTTKQWYVVPVAFVPMTGQAQQ